ncbi:hypothetical protein, unlikely [Trypanosoma brucei gambiense DAL972]|uniref:T. brucei spp.-specific protein n=1 Tax=Trypanosoma brucei gambiense (strain MHOM/CI/86/DAL972) TaxID=679716 RepID=C9ZNJ9_TRYB9|nr:hypothetical protein, unlikely [Trypanosoma brucei gambiense DAL972]CBH10977.1 hypothetical protein, unlikely [Trypanosoma brucei gambiense DAL972]|eukprot:XP_011773264.1 hypothetical protein, unlikely [Trypanosoma brucei gambiense DAL972]
MRGKLEQCVTVVIVVTFNSLICSCCCCFLVSVFSLLFFYSLLFSFFFLFFVSCLVNFLLSLSNAPFFSSFPTPRSFVRSFIFFVFVISTSAILFFLLSLFRLSASFKPTHKPPPPQTLAIRKEKKEKKTQTNTQTHTHTKKKTQSVL